MGHLNIYKHTGIYKERSFWGELNRFLDRHILLNIPCMFLPIDISVLLSGRTKTLLEDKKSACNYLLARISHIQNTIIWEER